MYNYIRYTLVHFYMTMRKRNTILNKTRITTGINVTVCSNNITPFLKNQDILGGNLIRFTHDIQGAISKISVT